MEMTINGNKSINCNCDCNEKNSSNCNVIVMEIRDVTKVKNICIRQMRITLLFVEYRMRIANTKYQY